MDKEKAIARINDSDSDDFQVFTKAEHESFLNNLKDTEPFKKEISSTMGTILGEIDNVVFDTVGEKRTEGVKTTDFIKTHLTRLNSEIQSSGSKIGELEKALDEKGGDNEQLTILKNENAGLKTKHQAMMDDWKGKYETLENDGKQSRIMSEFDRSLMGVKFKDAKIIPEDVRSAMIEKAKSNLLGKATFVNGVLAFDDGKGDVLRDDKLNPLTAQDLLKIELKSIVDEGRQASGVNIDEPVIKDEDGKIDVNLNLPDTVKTNADLTTFLMQSGLQRGSKEYHAAYAKYSEKLEKV